MTTTLADKLYHAQTSGQACAPLRETLGTEDLSAAYAIQRHNIDRALAAGQHEVGKKIGLTSKKVQAQLGVDQPDFGVLLNTMQIANGATLPFSVLMQPKVEAEIAFVLKDDLTTGELDIPQLQAAIDYAVPAIEIVGSRIKNWDISITDTIADNASSSHFVLGDRHVQLADLDLVNCKMQLYRNEELASEGQGKACLGNPLKAALWLARKMQELGNPLKAGEVILSGALGPMAVITKGDVIETEITGLGKAAFTVD